MSKKMMVLKVFNDKVFLNPEHFVAIQNTNIPYEHMAFRSDGDIYWKVEQLDYLLSDRSLRVIVKEYRTNALADFESQRQQFLIDKLVFEKFNWQELEPLLMYYQKSRLKESLLGVDAHHSSKREANGATSRSSVKDIQSFTSNREVEQKPTAIVITEEFWIDFDDTRFVRGYVTFTKHIEKIDRDLDLKIPNEHILAEFDNVKSWFAKKLGSKRIYVLASITFANNEVTEIFAKSSQIEQITPDLIESVKDQRTASLARVSGESTSEKSLFTLQEIFDQLGDSDVNGNIFNQSENDVFDSLLKKEGIRNKEQLTYLADKKHSENYRLRYTLKPNFGFLFLIEGEENNHFVWELLNSHATYVWSIGNGKQDVEQQFKRIEGILNNVRTDGRNSYVETYKRNLQDNDLVFRRIFHKKNDATARDSFAEWRRELNGQLT
ncbi:hypothetical protein GCM10009119_19570 [Algoriphagus jejuensis]|uniref:Uncharacterized protein n=1 Tax=Algoriphagus jejuensis TaxID=419934 RepID=A0ABN1MZM6_9BACT